MVLVGVTVAVPESGFRLLVLTAGVMLIVDAPVRLQVKVLDCPENMLAGEAKKNRMLGAEMTPPPPPPPLGGAVTVTVVWAVVVPM